MSAPDIHVGGRQIFGSRPATFSRHCFILKPLGLQGWQGLPSGRREVLARAVQHGEHDTRVFLPSRVVTIDAWAIARNEYDLGRAIDEIVGVGATGDRIDVSVAMHGQLRRAVGRRMLVEADDSGVRNGHDYYGEFQMQLVFADPRKYGEKTTSPESGTATSIDVSSWGNFPAYPEIELVSPPASYTISSPGGSFTVTGATPGGVHVVNLRTGRVYRAGVEMPGVGRGDLWAVPAAQRWRHTLSTPGRIRIADTFI